MKNNGQSLIEILIATAIMGTLALGMATLVNNQSRETRALTEKLANLDFQQALTAAMSDGSVCEYVLNNPRALTFDSTKPMPQTIVLDNPSAAEASLYSSVSLTPTPTPGPVIAKVGERVSPLANSLVVKSIELNVSAGSGANYIGNWIVRFDDSKLVRSFKPASASTILVVDSTFPQLSKIVKCQKAGSAGGGQYVAGQPCTTSGFPNNTGVVMYGWRDSTQPRAKAACCGPWWGQGWGCDGLE